MYELSVNKSKNRIYLRLQGFMNDQEIQEASAQVIKEINTLGKDFDLINDLTSFKPASPAGAQEMMYCIKYAYEHGLRHVIRVVGANAISRMQFDRLAKTTGSSSVTEEVSSREEAERRLDQLNTKPKTKGNQKG